MPVSDRITVANGLASGFTLCPKAVGDLTENFNLKKILAF